MFRCWVPFQGHEWQMVATQSTVNLLLLSKKCYFLDKSIFWLFWRTFMPLSNSPLVFYTVIMKRDYCIWWPCKMFSVALMWHTKGVFSLCNICRLKTKNFPLCQSIQLCVHEYPFPMRQAFWWQVRKYFFLLIWGRRN